MTCTKCGATLADNAQYCMQCGTPAVGLAAEASPIAAGAFVGPALMSGTVMGILSSIPIVSCLCCAWMLGGGGFAAWLVSRNTARGGAGLSYGDGAFAGVLAGVWGGIVRTLALGVPLLLFPGLVQDQAAELEEMLNEYPDLPEQAREMLMGIASGDLSLPLLLFSLISNILLYGLFAMIGGILIVALLRKQGAPFSGAPSTEPK
jgi:hypothetical protein